MKFILLFLMGWSSSTWAAETCTGHLITPADICWDCFFPLTIGASPLHPSGIPDTPNPSSPFCLCWDGLFPRFGLATGFWEPIAVTEVTRKPFCLPNLGGRQFPWGKNLPTGDIDSTDPTAGGSTYYVHWYRYPLMDWVAQWIGAFCVQGVDSNPIYFSELDPTWDDDALAFLLAPESALLANPLALLACAADATATLQGTALDALFWCAGSQGGLYPLTGHVQEHASAIQASLLLTERVDFRLHRLGRISDTSPGNLCSTYQSPTLPKSRYRYQLLNPVAKADTCYPFGHGTLTWDSGIEKPPLGGDDYGYLIWRKRNCCGG